LCASSQGVLFVCSLMLIPADTQTPVSNITVKRRTALCRGTGTVYQFPGRLLWLVCTTRSA